MPPPPPPPPPQVQACESAGAASADAGKDEPARPSSDQPIPAGEASAQARDASSTTDVRTKDGEIPLVTVEERGGRPEVTSTPVDSPDEAAAVAEQKAADGDLVAIDVDRPVKASTNDPRFGEQWAFTQVPFVDAWTTDGTQGAGVTVAVVDSGVQQSHPDLAGQVLNGHFFLHDNSGGTPFEGSGGTSDPSGHGSHVAGSVAALSGNQIGVSGAAPGVDILPVQVLCEDGVGFSSDVASGIIWAVDNGADVINLSLGGGPTNAEQSAVEYADQQNVVVVAAGGNDGTGGPPSYPASYSLLQPNVIAVAATTNATPPGHPSYGTTGSYRPLCARWGERELVGGDAVDGAAEWLRHKGGHVDGDAARLGGRGVAHRGCRLQRQPGEEPPHRYGGGPRERRQGRDLRARPRQPERRRRALHLSRAQSRP